MTILVPTCETSNKEGFSNLGEKEWPLSLWVQPMTTPYPSVQGKDYDSNNGARKVTTHSPMFDLPKTLGKWIISPSNSSLRDETW